MSRGERGSRFGLDGLQQPTIGIRGQVTKTQNHDGTMLRRTISQIEPRRGFKFVKSFVRRAALATVSFIVECRVESCAWISHGFIDRAPRARVGVYGCVRIWDGPGDPERTPRMTRRRRKWEKAVPSAREDRHHSQRATAAEGCRQGVYDRMNGDSEFAWFGSHRRAVEITGTIGHYGQRTRGSRIRGAKGTARGYAGWQ